MVKISVSNKYIENTIKALDSEKIEILDIKTDIRQGKTFISLEKYPTDENIFKKLQKTDWESV